MKQLFFKYFNKAFIICILFMLPACSATKYLKDEETLLRKNKIEVISAKNIINKSELQDELLTLIRQKPNAYLLGIAPVKTWLYNSRYNHYHNDSTSFQVKSKTVEPAVVIDTHAILESQNNMQQLLQNKGFFNADVHYSIKTRNKKGIVKYHVNTGSQYLVHNTHITNDHLFSDKEIITKWNHNSLIKKGMPFTNELLIQERSRLISIAKESGYYKFSTDNITFELDTTINKNELTKLINIDIIINDNDTNSLKQFTINKVVVYTDFRETDKINDTTLFVEQLKGIYYHQHLPKYLNPDVLDNKIFLRPHTQYRQSNYDKTISELNELGLFQSIRIFMLENKSISDTSITTYVLISPGKKYDFITNFEVTGGDLYFAGTNINLSATDKNLFKSASQLTYTLSYGVELNQSQNKEESFFERFYLLSQNVGFNMKLVVPKFSFLGIQSDYADKYMTKTLFNLGFNELSRTGYFKLQNINASYGFQWRTNKYTSWTFNPIFINSLHLNNVSDSFQIRLNEVQAIRNSYQETFIEGQNIEYFYNNEGKKPNYYSYLRFSLGEAGSLMSLINKGYQSIYDKGLPFTYANYFRFDYDVRQYLNRRKSSFNFRFYGGIGIPYSHSNTLPYIKQYFVGGPYSIRGWGARLLGPGSYYNPNAQNKNERLFIDQSGDIKLELNSEYRFNVVKLFSGAIGLSGAVFADAGNIWLAHKDINLPGAEFKFDKLGQDIGVSTGAGLRADFGGFLILRADWAFPVKKPYVFNGNSGWVIEDIKFGSKDWRTQNINMNVAIGFPF